MYLLSVSVVAWVWTVTLVRAGACPRPDAQCHAERRRSEHVQETAAAYPGSSCTAPASPEQWPEATNTHSVMVNYSPQIQD